jgi:hypothetical protein
MKRAIREDQNDPRTPRTPRSVRDDLRKHPSEDQTYPSHLRGIIPRTASVRRARDARDSPSRLLLSLASIRQQSGLVSAVRARDARDARANPALLLNACRSRRSNPCLKCLGKCHRASKPAGPGPAAGKTGINQTPTRADLPKSPTVADATARPSSRAVEERRSRERAAKAVGHGRKQSARRSTPFRRCDMRAPERASSCAPRSACTSGPWIAMSGSS